jgi:hypothetical protein
MYTILYLSSSSLPLALLGGLSLVILLGVVRRS